MHTSVCICEAESRNIRLTENIYERLKRRKREGESFSDTVERLVGDRSVLDLAGVLTDEEVVAMRNTIDEEAESECGYLDRLTKRMDT